MRDISIHTKLDLLPRGMKQEVADFIDFLLAKSAKVEHKPTPRFGSAKGKIIMAPDFDEPLDDFKEYM